MNVTLNLALLVLVLLRLEVQAAPVIKVNRSDAATALRKGQLAIAKKDFNDAVAECDDGLKKLGAVYVRNDVEDDTDQKLAAANILRKEGKAENASLMYCRVLAERLNLLRKK